MNAGLLGEDGIRSLARLALEHSCAEQTEVSVSAGHWALTRFANSSIHQNMAAENAAINVRAVFGKKVASAGTNRLDESGIRDLVDRVVEMARVQDPNPDFVSLPGPSDLPEVQLPESQEDSAAARAQASRAVIDEAARFDATAAGSVSTRFGEQATVNSLGVDVYQRRGTANLLTVVTASDGGFGYASAVAANLAGIEALAVGKEAAERAHASRSPAALEPGEYECVLLPYAVSNIVQWLAGLGFNALAYQENRSFVCGKLGRRIVDERVSIWDDGLDPRTIATPYDAEGVPKQRVDLIVRGVATALPYDSYTAHREKKASTGHAGGCGNLIMEPGEATLEEMIASTERGLLVTRFHYTNLAHLMTATITGMTRDGTFLIEKGRLSGPVKNLRFTQSILDALSNLDLIGRDLKLVNGTLVAALKVRGFRFSSATEF